MMINKLIDSDLCFLENNSNAKTMDLNIPITRIVLIHNILFFLHLQLFIQFTCNKYLKHGLNLAIHFV